MVVTELTYRLLQIFPPKVNLQTPIFPPKSRNHRIYCKNIYESINSKNYGKFRAVGTSKRLQQEDGDHHYSQPSSTVDVQRLVDFLSEDLSHVFDDQGIDGTAYGEGVKFQDPLTKYDSRSGYLFYISVLKLFSPDLALHWVKQTGPYEITTRWTVVMKIILLPWKPELVFTGTTVMAINPQNGKFCNIADFWDSIENNQYFSLEGLLYVFNQLMYCKTTDLRTPKYQILKKTTTYEVRKYKDKLYVPSGFNNVTWNRLKGTAAVIEFNGKPTEEVVLEKERLLRTSLVKDGLNPRNGCLLTNRYHNSKSKRSEVLIWLEQFALD